MQLRKIVSAGTLAALMAGSSIAFAANLGDLPQPFITSAGADDFLVVVGSKGTDAAGLASDIAGAINIAARFGGETGTSKTVGATTAGASVSGEGKIVATTNTKVFLDDDMGKTGLRNTMTKDDLPAILKTATLEDSDVSINSIYQQFIYLTPGDTSSAVYDLQYDQHGTTSIDPEYNFGEFPTSPTNGDYFYRTYVTFDKGVNSTAAGEKVTFFGKTFTVHSDTIFSGSTPKLVLSGGADTILLKGGETRTVTISGKSYDVAYVASSDADTGIVRVGSDQKSIDQGKSSKVGGLDVFMDRVFDVSSTDPTQDSAQLLLGAEKTVLQDGSKVKVGDNEDNVEGTYVNLTVSVTSGASRLDAFSVRVGGRSSNDDFLAEGKSYTDPVWKTFSVNFAGVTPAKTDASRSVLKITPSGDNLLQLEATDDRGNLKTVTWAYKGAATSANFTLGDSSGNRLHVVENATIRQDESFVVDAGEFSHLFKLTSISVTAGGAASDSVDITDIYSGVATKVNIGADGIETKVIDGQSYYFGTNTTAVQVTWGNAAAAVQGAANNTDGDFQTLFPGIKGAKGEWWHFYDSGVNITVANGTRVQLPTGAINFTLFNASHTLLLNITAVSKESGTASALATSPVSINTTTAGATGTFTLGRTATGGLIYNLTTVSYANAGQASVNIKIVGDSGAVGVTKPGILLVEEKDDSSNVYSVFVSASTETSGSNNVAIPAAPVFTSTEDTTTGADSTVDHYVDLYGVYAKRTTSGQDTVTLYYPDDQVVANLAVVGLDGKVSLTGGAAGASVRESVPIKTAVARLDSEVTAADRTTKNLVLVGGPAVNSLVAELAAANKTWDVAKYRAEGKGTAVLNLVDPGFGTGKVALVVAGHSADDTRAVASVLQDFGTHKTALAGKMLAVWKNGVISSTLSK